MEGDQKENMLDRHFLQSFLKVNNASPSMSDEEVRNVLTKAAWSKSEIDAAMTLLRTGAQGSITPHSPGADVFNPNMEFSSKQLSNLLGVDVVVDPGRLQYQYPAGAHAGASTTHTVIVRIISGFGIAILSLGLAIAVGTSFLYYLKIGPFAL